MMDKIIITSITLSIMLFACNTELKSTNEEKGIQSKVILDMISAVNEKNAEKYVVRFADDVQVFVESEMKIDGKGKLQANRAEHFKKFPYVKSEIQHLVEIDNKVILHDKVWFEKSDKEGQDIVEIFTFQNGQVVRVYVIQHKNLF